VARLMSWCREVTQGQFDGVTISGGEPFEQADALADLLDAFVDWRTSAGLEFDLLCYSGYPLTTLRKRHARLLKKLDAVIAEPYVDKLPMTQIWRGSANQILEPLSERGHALYDAQVDAVADEAGKRIQLKVEDSKVWFIGIPSRGDMSALEAQCRELGVSFSEASWRQ
jgi:anaerobic ribonucleoside-triphosphate reductase activating protein